MKRATQDDRNVYSGYDPDRTSRIPCGVCDRTTRNNKPWCSDHILEHSLYVRQILQEIAQGEIDRYSQHPSPAGIVAHDVLCVVQRNGLATLDRIAKSCRLSRKQAERHVMALVRAGQVVLGVTSLGRATATLVTPDKALV